MIFLRYTTPIALFCLDSTARALSFLSPQPSHHPARCHSYGVDFQNGGSYCINSASTENFTFVSEFKGCTMTGPNTFADTLLILPNRLDNGAIIRCSDVVDTSPFTKQLSTCPITKSNLVSGDYVIILAGNNGDGAPYAYFRNFTLKVGIRETATVTPTVTQTITSTPYKRITATFYKTITDTLDATATFYAPSATAPCLVTVRPDPVTATIPQTVTWHRNVYSVSQALDFVAIAPTCIYPPPWPDPTFAYWPYVRGGPSNLWDEHQGVGQQRVQQSTWNKYLQRAQEQSRNADQYLHQIKERAPDACAVTVTASRPVFVTSTALAPASTETVSRTITLTVSTHLRPSTVRYGTTTRTITAKPVTRTRAGLMYETAISTDTWTVTHTQAYIVTPPGARASCRAMGGYLAGQDGW